jgi:hypothetical protein
MSDSSSVQLYFAAETSFGVEPAAALRALRFTSESLKKNTTTEQSDEISADRSTRDLIRTAVSAGGDINLELSYGTYDLFLAAAVGGAWAVDGGGAGIDRLENGILKPSFWIDKGFIDVTEYFHYNGMMVDAFSLDIPTQGKVTGRISLMGLNETASGALEGGGAALSATTTGIVNSVDNINTVTEGGGAFSGCIDRISFDIRNNLRPRYCVGSAAATAVGLGQLQISGTLRAHFTSRTLYEKYLNMTASSLGFTITDSAGNAYIFSFPRIKYSDGQVVAGGNNQDVVADLTFTAIKDAGVTDDMIRIDRNPA